MNGEQRVIRDDEAYKNKLSALAKIKFKCYRWVLTDHTSSTIIPWYTEAAGENQLSLAEFVQSPSELAPFLELAARDLV